MKQIIFILILAALFRVPSFLYTEVSGDSRAYFNQAIEIFNNGYSSAQFEAVHREKIFFTSFISVLIGPLYKLNQSERVTVAIFSLIVSLTLVFTYWVMIKNIYGKTTAFWSSLLFAILPYNIFFSNTLLAHNYILLFLFSGLFFLRNYLTKNKLSYLIISVLLLASMVKIRPEGLFIYFLIFLSSTYLIIKGYFENTPYSIQKRYWKKYLLVWMGGVVLIYLINQLMISSMGNVADSNSGGSNPILGKAMGNMARRVYAIFSIEPQGSFSNSGKIEYLSSNLKLVFAVLALYIYDLFKTMLVLPLRVIPPYIWLFAGVSLALPKAFNGGIHNKTGYFTFILGSIFIISFIYPVLYMLAHSRYMYLIVPISCLAAGVGFNFLICKIKFHPSLVGIIFLLSLVTVNFTIPYTGFYYKTHKNIFSNKVINKSAMEKTIDYINGIYHNNYIPVMGLGPNTSLLKNKTRLDFPKDYISKGFFFYPDTISLAETTKLLKDNSPALMVIQRNNSTDNNKISLAASYFSGSLKNNNTFGDEGLELMRSPMEKDYSYIYDELLLLVDNKVKYSDNYELVSQFNDSNSTYYLFEFGFKH